jgi:CBS domain-containing membrane protein
MGAAREAGLPEAWPRRHGGLPDALWSAVTSSVLVAIAAIFAVGIHSVFLFASLGAIVHDYVERPLARASSPRCMIVGNAIALGVGYAVVALFGLARAPETVHTSLPLVRACAVVSGLAITTFALVISKSVNPPSAATVMLVTLGIIRRPIDLVYVFAMIVVITIAAWLLNRFGGIRMPLWSSPDPAPRDAFEGR